MQQCHHLKLGGLLQLNLHELYESDAIDCIKDELEALHGVGLQKINKEGSVEIRCENADEPRNCHYRVKFSTEFRIDRPSRMVLRLVKFFVQHHPQCRNTENANYLRNKHILNQNYLTIVKLVRRRYQDGQTIKHPTHVLELLCEQEKLSIDFIYEGLENLETRRRIKKRFDNIVADAKKRCRQLIFQSSGEKTKQEEELDEKHEEAEKKQESMSEKIRRVQNVEKEPIEPVASSMKIKRKMDKVSK